MDLLNEYNKRIDYLKVVDRRIPLEVRTSIDGFLGYKVYAGDMDDYIVVQDDEGRLKEYLASIDKPVCIEFRCFDIPSFSSIVHRAKGRPIVMDRCILIEKDKYGIRLGGTVVPWSMELRSDPGTIIPRPDLDYEMRGLNLNRRSYTTLDVQSITFTNTETGRSFDVQPISVSGDPNRFVVTTDDAELSPRSYTSDSEISLLETLEASLSDEGRDAIDQLMRERAITAFGIPREYLEGDLNRNE